MKKLGLFLCAIALTIGVSQAQSFNFGIKGGVTLNSLSYDQEAGLQAEANPGFNVGAFFRLYIGEKFYLQPEVAYSFGKFNFDVDPMDVLDGTVGQDIETQFEASKQGVSIPVLFGYRVLDLKVANLRVFAGPEFMISTGNFEQLTSDIQALGPNFDFDANAFGVSGLAGIGVDALMLSLDLRYSYPFTNNFVIGGEETNFKGWVVSLAWKIF
jgi:hypothetical protein